MRSLTPFAVAALLGAACIPEEGPTMEPGSDCLECHGRGGGEDNAVAWTVAGTWSGQGRHVDIRDAAGKSFTLRTNQVGNFYTREPVTLPIVVAVDGQAMGGGSPTRLSPPDNSCNRCHGSGGGGD